MLGLILAAAFSISSYWLLVRSYHKNKWTQIHNKLGLIGPKCPNCGAFKLVPYLLLYECGGCGSFTHRQLPGNTNRLNSCDKIAASIDSTDLDVRALPDRIL